MPKGYVIANVDVTNPEAYADYARQVPATIEQYGGRYLVRGGEQVTKEGEAPLPRTVILEFPSLEQAQAWYDSPEYQGVVGIRHANATNKVYLVEGT